MIKNYEIKKKAKNGREYTFVVEEFPSAYELAETNRHRAVTPQWKGDCLEAGEIEKGWHGVESRDEAYDFLRDGWTQELESVNAMMKKVTTVTAPKRSAFKNDVVGFAPVVPLAMMNVPNSMLNTNMKPVKSKIVKILYDITDSCSTKPETFLKRGKRIMEVIIGLERSGYRCELYAMQSYYSDRKAEVLLVKIKESNQPLDVRRMMFPLTHPAFFRVVGFEWQDRFPPARRLAGRGHALKFEDNHDELIKSMFGTEFVFLDAQDADMETEDIKKKLKGEK